MPKDEIIYQLLRYDSYRPGNSFITDFSFNKKNEVFIATLGEGVLHMINGEVVGKFATSNGLPSNFLNCVAVTKGRNFVAGGYSGLTVHKDGQVSVESTDDGLPEQNVISLAYHNDQLFVLTPHTISIRNSQGYHSVPVETDQTNRVYQSLDVGITGNLKLTSDSGLYTYDNGSFKQKLIPGQYADVQFTGYLQTHDHREIFSAATAGLFFNTKRGVVKYHPQWFTDSIQINWVLHDSADYTYLATNQGLYYYDEHFVGSYSAENGLKRNTVEKMVQEPGHSFWFKYDTSEYVGILADSINHFRPLPGENITDIKLLPDYRLLVTGESSLALISDLDVEPVFLNSGKIHAAEPIDNRLVVVQSQHGGVELVDLQQGVAVRDINTGLEHVQGKLTFDTYSDNRLVACSSTNFYEFDGVAWTGLGYFNRYHSESDLFIDARNKVYHATPTGVQMYFGKYHGIDDEIKLSGDSAGNTGKLYLDIQNKLWYFNGTEIMVKPLPEYQAPWYNRLEISEDLLLDCYPNPANDRTLIKYKIDYRSTVSIQLFNLSGKEIFGKDLGRKEEGEHSFLLNTSGFKEGVYLYRLMAKDYSLTSPIHQYSFTRRLEIINP